MINRLKENPVYFIVLIAIVSRVFAGIFFGDRQLDMEYDAIVRNLLDGRGVVYFVVDEGGEITNQYIENPQMIIPSAYLPTWYSFFLAGLGSVFGIDSVDIIAIGLLQAV